MAKISVFFIELYQHTISFDHGPIRRFVLRGAPPMCRYHPTCSEYGVTAITKYGFIKGWKLTLLRILRCHPWSTHDPFNPVV